MQLKKIVNKALRIINYVFTAGLLLSYLSVYVSPRDIAMLAFFGLLYPLFLLFNALFVLYWILRKKWLFLIPALAILTGATHFNDFFRIRLSKLKELENYHSFQLLSYNVRLFNLYGWNKSHHVQQDIFRLIENEEPEIVCFQEYFENSNDSLSNAEKMLALYSLNYSHISYLQRNAKRKIGLAVFSSYPIVRRGEIRFYKPMNICNFVDIKIGDDTIRVYNNHLMSIGLGYRDYDFIDSLAYEKDNDKWLTGMLGITRKLRYAFRQRAKQVDFLAEAIHNSPYPAIICGDFNDTPVSYTYRTIKGDKADAFVRTGIGLGDTYAGNLPVRIDYILHSRNLHSFDFNVLKISLSDHYPITCRFAIGKPD